MATSTTSEVRRIFEEEFAPILDRFSLTELTVEQAQDRTNATLAKPGVYVWWHPQHGAIKVGRHLVNARKRALEHVQDDTGGLMRRIGEDPATRLLLILTVNERDRHWTAAIEMFLEVDLDPHIRSKRMG